MRRLTLILAVYAAIITAYSAPFAKYQAKEYTKHTLESALVALNDKPDLKVRMDTELVADLPPPKDIKQLAEAYPAGNSDIIREILEGAK